MTARTPEERHEADQRGRQGEAEAAMFLAQRGWRILAERVKTKAGEIDLVACRGRLLVFVEVKARATHNAAFEAVTVPQRRRVEEAARLWVGRRPRFSGFSWRFDVIAVAPKALPKHLRDAWRPEIALSGRQGWPRT